jgi:hypothetical protein
MRDTNPLTKIIIHEKYFTDAGVENLDMLNQQTFKYFNPGNRMSPLKRLHRRPSILL